MTLLEEPTAPQPSPPRPATPARGPGPRYLPWSSPSGAVQAAASVRGAATLVEVFAATVARVPHAPALDDGVRVLSYRDLDLRVARMAGRLAEAGLRRGDRIGIQLASGHARLYVAILAVLRLGAAYVPVDHDDPPARAELVFGDAQVAAIITDQRVVPGPGHQPRSEPRHRPHRRAGAGG